MLLVALEDQPDPVKTAGSQVLFGDVEIDMPAVPEHQLEAAALHCIQLEQQQPAPQQPAQGAPDDGQLGLQDLAANAICQRLETAAPETMTPIEALNFIFELKQLL